jgi:hypothetical protein
VWNGGDGIMGEHTQRPWRAEKNPTARVVCIVPHEEYREDDWYVTTENLRENCENDAIAIAAMPDLLAACEAVLEWAYASSLTEQGTIGYFGEFVAPMVDEAVKKARGA